MFLSRIVLPESVQAARFLADWHQLHDAVLTSCPRGDERALFRLETPGRRGDQPTAVLVQSDTPPLWTSRVWPSGTQFDVPKPISIEVTRGLRLRYRLRANPTVKRKVNGKDNGRRDAVTGEERQLEWFQRKAATGGFRVCSCVIVDETELEFGKPDGRSLTFRSVLFEGVLEVGDAAVFTRTLRVGIGSGKAFGFGLLSIAPARS